MLGEAEIAQLYTRFGHAIYRRCLSLVGNPDDARELMQETFFQFCKGQARFEGRSAPFTFLYRIATNLSIDRLRRRKTAGDQVPLEEAGGAGRSGGNMAVTLGVNHRGFGASAALHDLAVLTQGLDEETLTIAVMSHVDGLTQDEIAEALDLSRRTIGKKLKKFLQHTRGRLVEVQSEAREDETVSARKAHDG